MAGERVEGCPPDGTEQIYYKCHPKQPYHDVVCLICECAYHRSDFIKTGKIRIKNKKIKDHKPSKLTSQARGELLSGKPK